MQQRNIEKKEEARLKPTTLQTLPIGESDAPIRLKLLSNGQVACASLKKISIVDLDKFALVSEEPLPPPHRRFMRYLPIIEIEDGKISVRPDTSRSGRMAHLLVPGSAPKEEPIEKAAPQTLSSDRKLLEINEGTRKLVLCDASLNRISDVVYLQEHDQWALNSRQELLVLRQDPILGSLIDVHKFSLSDDTFKLRSLPLGQKWHANINKITPYPCGLIFCEYQGLPPIDTEYEDQIVYYDVRNQGLAASRLERNPIRKPGEEYDLPKFAFWSLDKNDVIHLDTSFTADRGAYAALPDDEGILYYSQRYQKLMVWDKTTEQAHELAGMRCSDILYVPQRNEYLFTAEGLLHRIEFPYFRLNPIARHQQLSQSLSTFSHDITRLIMQYDGMLFNTYKKNISKTSQNVADPFEKRIVSGITS
ncbi:MAG: hypothetical protein ACYCQI_07420 [Gammaproteobacteria bacterium]